MVGSEIAALNHPLSLSQTCQRTTVAFTTSLLSGSVSLRRFQLLTVGQQNVTPLGQNTASVASLARRLSSNALSILLAKG